MGARSRTKGANWEREFSERLREIGVPAKRVLTECRDGNVGDVETALPIGWQLKVGGRPDIYGAVAEARQVADPKGHYAVAIIKRNGAGNRKADELAVLPLDDFLEIVDLLVAGGLW